MKPEKVEKTDKEDKSEELSKKDWTRETLLMTKKKSNDGVYGEEDDLVD